MRLGRVEPRFGLDIIFAFPLQDMLTSVITDNITVHVHWTGIEAIWRMRHILCIRLNNRTPFHFTALPPLPCLMPVDHCISGFATVLRRRAGAHADDG